MWKNNYLMLVLPPMPRKKIIDKIQVYIYRKKDQIKKKQCKNIVISNQIIF